MLNIGRALILAKMTCFWGLDLGYDSFNGRKVCHPIHADASRRRRNLILVDATPRPQIFHFIPPDGMAIVFFFSLDSFWSLPQLSVGEDTPLFDNLASVSPLAKILNNKPPSVGYLGLQSLGYFSICLGHFSWL